MTDTFADVRARLERQYRAKLDLGCDMNVLSAMEDIDRLLTEVARQAELLEEVRDGVFRLRTEYARRMLMVSGTPMEQLWRDCVDDLDTLSRLQEGAK
jgi:hypothetical protein